MINLRNRYLLLLDAATLFAAPFFCFMLRFEGIRWPNGYAETALEFAVVGLAVQLATYFTFGLYRRFWRFASTSELKLIFTAGLCAGVMNVIVGRFIVPDFVLPSPTVPMSVLFSYIMLSVAFIAAPRLLVRVSELTSRRRPPSSADRRALIVGAGSVGHMVARELLSHPTLELRPVGFVDDDRDIHGLRLENLPVLGSLDDIPALIELNRVHEIVIALPNATGKLVRRIVEMALAAGVKTRTVPALGEIISGSTSNAAHLRTVEIQDLLRREPITTDLNAVAQLAEDSTVLVTGAGGSIGSELCRQLAESGPERIVMVGRGENSIFEINNELRAKYPNIKFVPIIADIRDRRRIRNIMMEYRPRSVFHAAAHKHVPLMEEHPGEAVTNNIMGTRNVVEAAVAADVDHFVLISTDKAVRPTNVMGASKRAAELVVKHASSGARGSFVSVRFGNVLGSRGSVVPTFVQQIRAGGPVTITHPEMRRFFMTISEAVQLVLQAGAAGKNGELFMLDMGEPVKVVDLAADLIRLSGLEVGTDIEIKFVGARPGEKLYEEMFWGDEVAEPTEHPKVLRAKHVSYDERAIALIDDLIDVATENAGDVLIRDLLRVIVPDFAPANHYETPGGGMALLARGAPPADVRRSDPRLLLPPIVPRRSNPTPLQT